MGCTVSEDTAAHNPAIVHRLCKSSHPVTLHVYPEQNPFMASIQHIRFELRGDFIPLDSLLKVTGLADSGGRAKTMVAEGMVQVDGQDESRKTAKIRAGQVVSLHGVRITVLPEGGA